MGGCKEHGTYVMYPLPPHPSIMIPNMVNLATTVLHTVQWLFLVDVKIIFAALNLEGDKFTTLNCSQKKIVRQNYYYASL